MELYALESRLRVANRHDDAVIGRRSDLETFRE